MPRVHPDYYDTMKILDDRFPDYDMLSIEEVAQVLNRKSLTTVRKQLGARFVDRKLSKVKLAKYMCGEKN